MFPIQPNDASTTGVGRFLAVLLGYVVLFAVVLFEGQLQLPWWIDLLTLAGTFLLARSLHSWLDLTEDDYRAPVVASMLGLLALAVVVAVVTRRFLDGSIAYAAVMIALITTGEFTLLVRKQGPVACKQWFVRVGVLTLIWVVASHVTPLAGIAPAALVPSAIGFLATMLSAQSTTDWYRRIVLLMLVGCLVGAIAWLLMVRGNVVLLLVGFVVVTAACVLMVRRGNSDFALLGILTLVVWAVQPRSVPEPDIALDQGGLVVAIGDSYISGEGAKNFYEGTNLSELQVSKGDRATHKICRRAPTAYPVLVAKKLNRPLAFGACSGGVAKDIPQQIRTIEKRLETAGHSLNDVVAVLLQVGGNDVGFGEIAATCALPGDCRKLDETWKNQIALSTPKVHEAYREVHRKFERATVFVVPYPIALREKPCWYVPFGNSEQRYIRELEQKINAMVKGEADEFGFAYVGEAAEALTRAQRRLCDHKAPADAGINVIGWNPTGTAIGSVLRPQNMFHNSFHPNAQGHEAVAAVVGAYVEAKLSAAGDVPVRSIEEHPHALKGLNGEFYGVKTWVAQQLYLPLALLALYGIALVGWLSRKQNQGAWWLR